MKKRILFLTAVLFCISSMQASQTAYEQRAFEGRYSLWSNVRCVSDSVRVTVEFDNSLMAQYSVDQMEADMRSDLAGLAFPEVCERGVVPEPATMVSVELEIRTVVDDDGSLVYFVRLLAVMPDGDFVKTVFNQRTSWESPGKLGSADHNRSRELLRSAMSEEIGEFAAFMRKARTLRDG
jgi:hypothetical protein